MKNAREWISELSKADYPAPMERLTGRGGFPTVKIGEVYLHSRYEPEQEAQRLIDSAHLDATRPVLVIGLGLGYHVGELMRRGIECAVVEPDVGIAKLALEYALFPGDYLLGVGAPEQWSGGEAFRAFASRMPQTLIHPPTARLYPGYSEEVSAVLSLSALQGQRLSIAVVGPLYGGSLPITHYLADAFRSLGHNVLVVDNSEAWPLYEAVTGSVDTPAASSQLGQMLTNVLSEWSYARVAEFNPELCVVMAQAPVGAQFPGRLAQNGIVTGFWYVENWRHMPYWREIAPYYDVFFHIQPGEFEQKLDEAGCACHAFVQTGCDPSIHVEVPLSEAERSEYECDISFAGAGYYNRLQLFKGLTDYRFKIWGVDWPVRELSKLVVGGERRFSSEEFMKIVSGSKINLNLHSSTAHDGVDPKCDAINPRVFEIAAAGGFQLCDPCIGLERHFDLETEVPVYRNLKELRQRIDYYLAHPEERRAIAARARARVLREHTYVHRAQQMLDVFFARHGNRILRRGVRVQRSIGEMAEQAGITSPLGAWLSSLPAETPFLSDEINKLLPAIGEQVPYSVKVFYYMKEVGEFVDNMLKERR